MNPTDASVAWEHPPTRRAWSKQLAANALAVGWVALWVALLAILVVFLPPGYTILFVPFLLYSFYRAFLQLFVIPAVFRMRRVLREYPWRLYSDAPHGLADRPPTSSVGRTGGSSFPTRPSWRSYCPWCFPGTGEWAGGTAGCPLARSLN